MTQKKLSLWLKFIIIVILGLGGLFCLSVLAPSMGKSLAYKYPRYSYMYYPTWIFTWVCAIPFYYALYNAYLISSEIGNANSFCAENSHRLKKIGICAVVECALIFVALAAMFIMKVLHPVVAMILLVLILAVIAISVICFAISHLVLKAAKLQEENDLTI